MTAFYPPPKHGGIAPRARICELKRSSFLIQLVVINVEHFQTWYCSPQPVNSGVGDPLSAEIDCSEAFHRLQMFHAGIGDPQVTCVPQFKTFQR